MFPDYRPSDSVFPSLATAPAIVLEACDEDSEVIPIIAEPSVVSVSPSKTGFMLGSDQSGIIAFY